jgi:hypothetical protein
VTYKTLTRAGHHRERAPPRATAVIATTAATTTAVYTVIIIILYILSDCGRSGTHEERALSSQPYYCLTNTKYTPFVRYFNVLQYYVYYNIIIRSRWNRWKKISECTTRGIYTINHVRENCYYRYCCACESYIYIYNIISYYVSYNIPQYLPCALVVLFIIILSCCINEWRNIPVRARPCVLTIKYLHYR